MAFHLLLLDRLSCDLSHILCSFCDLIFLSVLSASCDWWIQVEIQMDYQMSMEMVAHMLIGRDGREAFEASS